MIQIPNDLAARFNSIEGRKALIEQYGNSNTMFVGINDDGEDVHVSISCQKGIVCRTFQHNGWTFVAVYDKSGVVQDSYFDGRWKEARQ